MSILLVWVPVVKYIFVRAFVRILLSLFQGGRSSREIGGNSSKFAKNRTGKSQQFVIFFVKKFVIPGIHVVCKK